VKVILRADHLTRVVEGRAIVDGVSIEVPEGDVLAIVGPSGSGKSSFLRLLNRLDEPTGGTVYLDGRDHRTIPPRELRRHVGMVLQTAFLFPGTVAENVRFGPQQRGEAMRDAEVERCCASSGSRGSGRDPSTTSRGARRSASRSHARSRTPRPSSCSTSPPLHSTMLRSARSRRSSQTSSAPRGSPVSS
jgi:putative ABC transport system ATP-binding protein